MNFKLRKAKKDDLIQTFELFNDSLVRQNSFSKEQVSLNEHKIWFNDKLNDKDCIFYIAETLDNKFIGQVRFDKQDSNNKSFIINISISSLYRNKGFGSTILQEVSKLVSNENKEYSIYAYIKKDNIVSVKSFAKAKYTIISEEIINGSPCYYLKFKGELNENKQ